MKQMGELRRVWLETAAAMLEFDAAWRESEAVSATNRDRGRYLAAARRSREDAERIRRGEGPLYD